MMIGILSFAHPHANGYAACLAELPGVDLAAIYDDNRERGQMASARYGAPFIASLHEFLDVGLDGVIVCSENVRHRNHVEQLAGRVGYILCEKPLATTVPDGEAMLAACEESGTVLQIAFPVRFSAPARRFKELVEAGTVGRIRSVKCTNHGRNPGGWFNDLELAGGGAVMDHTVHVVDLLRWVFGTELSEVYAEVGHGLLHDNLGIDDAGMLSFEMTDGVIGTLDSSWSRPPSYPFWGDVKLTAVGEKGTLLLDVFRQQISLTSEVEGRSKQVHWGSNPDMALVEEFVGAIRDRRQPSVTGLDGLRALEAVDAAYRAAESGKPIRLRGSENGSRGAANGN